MEEVCVLEKKTCSLKLVNNYRYKLFLKKILLKIVNFILSTSKHAL